jgi:hypothetical protein
MNYLSKIAKNVFKKKLFLRYNYRTHRDIVSLDR